MKKIKVFSYAKVQATIMSFASIIGASLYNIFSRQIPKFKLDIKQK